jgi:hypothetical protein
MTQITLQPVIAGVPQGSPIPLEVASFDESQKAKLRTYSRVQAFSDTSLIVGVYNSEFTLNIIVPQDFTNAEDIETLLAAMQPLDQILADVEGVSHNVRIGQISDVHTGGKPYLYTVDVTLTQTDG